MFEYVVDPELYKAYQEGTASKSYIKQIKVQHLNSFLQKIGKPHLQSKTGTGCKEGINVNPSGGGSGSGASEGPSGNLGNPYTDTPDPIGTPGGSFNNTKECGFKTHVKCCPYGGCTPHGSAVCGPKGTGPGSTLVVTIDFSNCAAGGGGAGGNFLNKTGDPSVNCPNPSGGYGVNNGPDGIATLLTTLNTKLNLDANQRAYFAKNLAAADAFGKYLKKNNNSTKAIQTAKKAAELIPGLDFLKQYWPKNAAEWAVVGEFFKSMALETVLGLTPGYDFVEAIKHLVNGNIGQAALAFGFGIASFSPAILLKIGKVALKLIKATTKIVKFIAPLGKVIGKGFKPKFVDDVLQLTNKNGKVIAKGEDAVESFVKVSGKLENLPNAKRIIENGADPNLVKRLDKLSTEQLNKLDDLYSSSKFKLPSDRPTVNGKKVLGDFTSTKTINGKQVSVRYDKNGFPDFKNQSLGKDFTYKADDLVGTNTSTDFTKATNWLKEKFPNKDIIKDNNRIVVDGKTYTWHHHQDGKSLMPVLSDVHGAFRHSGGNAIIKGDLKGLFSSPF